MLRVRILVLEIGFKQCQKLKQDAAGKGRDNGKKKTDERIASIIVHNKTKKLRQRNSHRISSTMGVQTGRQSSQKAALPL